MQLGGPNRNAPSMSFSGRLDESRFWHVALYADLIQTWMLSPLTSSHAQWVNLSAYYRMSDGAGICNRRPDARSTARRGALSTLPTTKEACVFWAGSPHHSALLPQSRLCVMMFTT